jgi:hypothetical protein
MTAMLLDHKRHINDVNLLDHPRRDRGHGLQVVPAPGALIEAIVARIAVDRFRREGLAFVLGMTGLPTDPASLLALRRCRLGGTFSKPVLARGREWTIPVGACAIVGVSP